ncbi:hypothetical protein [Streptomyces goshikiensis]|uniref:hypothetical protein n=1 Tax=Streptomyces goshikiensis TaxID=1942 RepID=UPI003660EC46
MASPEKKCRIKRTITSPINDGRPDPQKGRIKEVRDEGPHAVYRVRKEETNEIQVITHGQIV